MKAAASSAEREAPARRKPVPHGAWPSPITADFILSAFVSFAELQHRDGVCYWIETRPQEGGRSVLVSCRDGDKRDVIPASMNARSRVHEYGGGAFAISAANAWFVNFEDQNIHSVRLGGSAPQRVTLGDENERFGGLQWDDRRGSLIAVRERHGIADEAVNDLVRVRVDTGAIEVLHSGHDFYAGAKLSPDGAKLAFLVWDHPNMPWDGTQLVVAELNAAGGIAAATVVGGGAAESIFQPEWADANRLLYVSDAKGFWNLYVFDASGAWCAVPDEAEYGLPLWSLGMASYVPAGPRHAVAQRIEAGVAQLVVADIEQGVTTPLPVDFSSYRSLARTASGVAFIAGRQDDAAAVVELNTASGALRVLASEGEVDLPPGFLSAPESIRYPTANGEHAFGNFYAPRNADCEGPPGERPPLLVMSHGGPTGAASRDLSLRVQYYTSRGWAVLDVNYGGSTGFGRAYRERLQGKWGVVDVADCEAGVRFLALEGRVDPNRVAIRGGSAGGYTTLAALVFSDVFRAGASHYGVADLATLARDTHKFESRYLYALVDAANFAARSPIGHVDRLRCPTIFFQGADDRIVPRNQAETMYDALKAKGIPVAYLLFESEGHGFRRTENVRRAIEGEYFFFSKVFGFKGADDLPEVRVDNATWR